MTPELDPRLNAFRPDLADIRLQGRVESARFVEGAARRVVAPSAPLKRVPKADAPLESELIRGEIVDVFEATDEGWSWVQNRGDAYVGYIASDALGGLGPEPTHRVVALRTFIYPGPDMKLPAIGALSMGSILSLGTMVETRGTLYRLLADGEGAVAAAHVVPVAAPAEPDFVAIAERFLRVPYLWGGRTSLGLDCSALVQLSLMMAGRPAPRDSDMQEAILGEILPEGLEAKLRRGDLVFWRGHVGIMADGGRLLHASGYHMAVTAEPLSLAVDRIAGLAGRPTSVKRRSASSG